MHTQGPWSVHNNPTSNYGVEVVAPTAIKAKRVVCRVGGPDREANARVLAAAPDMLEALMEIASEQCCGTPGCSPAEPYCSTSLAAAAIAKATGAA